LKFQILKYSNGQYYWRLVAVNGKIIATSGESYVRKEDCVHSINIVKASVLSEYEVYQDAQRQWRWRLQAKNSQIVAVSSEAYVNRQDAVNGAALAASTNASTPVEDLTVSHTAYR
jgi:uncharacterized protein YegP (UPF0339 family)